MVDSNHKIGGIELNLYDKLISPTFETVDSRMNFIGMAVTKIRNFGKKVENFINRLGCFILKTHHWENDASLKNRIKKGEDGIHDTATQERINSIRIKLEERVKVKSEGAASALTDPVETSGGGADKTHEKHYYEALGKWVNEKKIPIKNLNLKEEELILLAPHLTYLDLTDDDLVPKFTDDFIKNLLEHSHNLTHLKIANSNITGAALGRSPLSKLTDLKIKNCPNFNPDDFSALENLESLKVTDCLAFNPDLSALENLESLEVSYCPVFNPDLSGLKNLKILDVFMCHFFNPDLIALPNLMSLKVRQSDAFNPDLSALEGLEILDVFMCPIFNPDLSGLKNLKSLKVFNCPAFSPENFPALEVLESLKVINCPAFHPFHSRESLQVYMRFNDLNELWKVFSNLPPKVRREICKNKPELLSEIKTLAKKKDKTGFSLRDKLIIPPANSFSMYADLLELSEEPTPTSETLSLMSEKYYEAKDHEIELLDQIWGRICERYPRLAQGKEDIPELEGFIEQVLAFKDNPDVISLLEWDYKMNRDLPMTKDAFLSILDLIETYPGDKNQIRLALQTHPNFEEIQKAVKEGSPSKPFPGKSEFFKMSPEEQQSFLCRAVVLRERKGLTVANKVIKDAIETKSFDKELLLFAMKLLQSTGIEGSSETINSLAVIVGSDPDQFDIDLKKQAALSLAELDSDPYSTERKKLFLEALKTDDSTFQQALIDSLGKYFYTEEDGEIAQALIKLADQTEDERVKVSIAFTLSVIPREDALKKSLEIVESDVWDWVDLGVRGYENLGIIGHYSTYNYRPSFHDNRDNMKRIIAERLVQMNRETLQDQVEKIMQEWRDDPESRPTVQTIAENIREIIFGVRYVPFQLWLPKGKVVFRGINARKGEKLGDAAFNDLLMKGAGSADLSLYDTYDNGTWAKVGQMFTSTTLKYVLSGEFFNKDGVLMTIASDEINEMQLRRVVRFEHEGSIHAVSYRRILTHQITQLFMRADRKSELQGIVDKNEQYVRLKAEKKGTVSTVEKIAARQLRRSVGKGGSLQERVSYFNPEGSLKEEVRRIMEEKGLAEASLDEIIEENVRRQIIRELLAERLEDSQLKACMQFASEVREAVTV